MSTETMAKGIANRIKDARWSAGLSQDELAGRLLAHPSAVSHWESGQQSPSLQNLTKLCVALGCSADRILGIASPIDRQLAELELRIETLEANAQKEGEGNDS